MNLDTDDWIGLRIEVQRSAQRFDAYRVFLEGLSAGIECLLYEVPQQLLQHRCAVKAGRLQDSLDLLWAFISRGAPRRYFSARFRLFPPFGGTIPLTKSRLWYPPPPPSSNRSSESFC